MKQFDTKNRAFRQHVAGCAICAKLTTAADFRGLELCDTGYALAGRLVEDIRRDPQFMRLLKKICERN
jgi:hypothetical protein